MMSQRTSLSSIVIFTLCCTWIKYTTCQGRPPVITEHPSDAVVEKNSPAELTCSASGFPEPKISWYRNGVEIPSERRRSILPNGHLYFIRTVSSKRKTDNGIYSCKAENRFGTVYSKNASLFIGTLKLTFRSEPVNQTVYVGESVVLKCSPPRGNPVPGITWLQHGSLVSNTSRTFISAKGNLTISPVTKADQGLYICRANSPLGTRDSHGASLTVKEKPGYPLTVMPSTKAILVGNNATFQCQYRDGSQDEVTWEKKNGALPNGRHFLDQGVLTITDAEKSDAGVYVCSVNTGIKELIMEAKLEVQAKPRIIQRPADVIANEGRSASFTCIADGEPQPTVFWEREGKASPTMFSNNYYNGGRIFVTRLGESLQISKVEKEDEGVYTCVALSLIGNSHAEGKLTVIGPTDVLPSIISGPSNQSVDERTDIVFSCQVDGSPEPSVSWFQNDDNVPLQNTSSVLITQSGLFSQLSISDVNISDKGVYRCVATSNIGTASQEAQLEVKKVITTTTPLPTTTPTPTPKPTLPPLDLIITTVTHNSVLLLWSSLKLLDSSAVEYVVEYHKRGSNEQWETAVDSLKENKFTVPNLEPDTMYVFNVRAVSQDGTTLTQVLKQVSSRTKKKPTVVAVKPTAPVNPMENVKIDVNLTPSGSDKINISWSLSEPVDVTGVVILWRKKDTDVDFYTKPDSSHGSFYSLNGLEANTTYEIQIQIMSRSHSGPKSTSAFATTHENQDEAGILLGGVSPRPGGGSSNGEVSIVEARGGSGDTWYKMKLFIRQPWFIGTMGAVAWIILMIVVLLLYRQRRNKRKSQKALATRVNIPSDSVPRSSGTRASKFLWMEERNSEPSQPLTNNRSSDSSASDCAKQMANCCRVRGGSSNGSIDFPNKITLNHLSGSGNQLDGHYSSMNGQAKTINLPNSNSPYHEHVNKSNKFLDSPTNQLGAPSGSRSPSESTLPKNGPKERIRYYDYTENGTNRSKNNSGSRRRDPNQTPSDSSDTEKTKPKLKIQSFEMAGNMNTTSTFHSEPPPTYEAVLKETEMEMQKFPLGSAEKAKDEADRKLEESKDDSSKQDASEARKSPQPDLERPSSPASERSCKTSTSCGSLQRKRKALKPPPRLAIFNWADLLPPPPSEPPPSSLGSPPPSPPFSERSAMTGMTGRTGMSGMSGMSGMTGMSGMSGMTGMTGMTGRTGMSGISGVTGMSGASGVTGMSGVTGKSGLTEPHSTSSPRRSHRKGAHTSNDGEHEQGSVAGKSEKSKKSRSKPKPIPIDLEGITSDIIMQWAESVTNTSGSEDDSSCSSPSRISGISSDGSFFTDADFANAVRVAAECGGFNTDAYGLMDSLGIPPPYAANWKRSNSFSNDNEASLGTAAAYGPRPLRKRWETGSEGDLEYTPPVRVRPRVRRDNEKGPNDQGPPRVQKGAPGELIRQIPGMRAPVPIVPSQPRRPLHRVARPGGPPLQANPAMLVQPLKKTTTLGIVDPREPLKKKYAIVKKIPQSQDNERAGGYQSCSMSSSKSSTSTASTVKSSSCAPTVNDDSDMEGSVA